MNFLTLHSKLSEIFIQQIKKNTMATQLFYENILSRFPQRNLRMAFAYGSGVFKQDGHSDMSKNMVDFIFVVDNSPDWHRENIALNSKHYSFLKYLGPGAVTWFQDKWGARIYFNTLVKCEGRLIKYGVIGTEALKKDLSDWESLYVSGRLHKPVYHVLDKFGHELEKAIHTNLQSALHTSLLLLPDHFKEVDLYETITGLSYSGDLRMTFGEDKNKVKNIVKPNIEKFRELYGPLLENEGHVEWFKSEGTIEQSLCELSRIHHLNLLPKELTDNLVMVYNKGRRNQDTEEILLALAHDCRCRYIVKDCVSSIVKNTSTPQALKGVLTAGLIKSTQYSWKKIQKMRKSQKKS